MLANSTSGKDQYCAEVGAKLYSGDKPERKMGY